jgi:hypothetical protein
MIKKYPKDFVIFSNTKYDYKVQDKVEFSIVKNLNYTYAQGIVPIKIDKKRSFDGFNIDVEVNHVEENLNWNPKAAADDDEPSTQENRTEEVGNTGEAPVDSNPVERVEIAPESTHSDPEENQTSDLSLLKSHKKPKSKKKKHGDKHRRILDQDSVETVYIPS